MANSAPLEVGVMTDPEDAATFTKVSDITLNGKESVSVYFADYDGDGKYIAFHTMANTAFKYEVDNIYIGEKSGCLKVSGLTAEVDGASVSLGWKGDTETKWHLVVSRQALSTAQLDEVMAGSTENKAVVFADVVNKNPYEIEDGLEYNMPYFFYVKSICGEGSDGGWSDAGAFRTGCGILTVDLIKTEDFESYVNGAVPACWTGGNPLTIEDLNNYGDPYIPVVSSELSHSGSNSLKIQSLMYAGGYLDNGGYIVSPEMDVDDISKLQMSFWGYAPYDETGVSQSQLRIGVVTDVDDPSTFVEQEVVSGYGEWYHYTIPFDLYEGDMNGQKGRRVMFRSDFSLQNEFYIDDVKFEVIPSCAAPAHVALDSMSSDYARIVWAAGNSPYTVKVANVQLSYEELNSKSSDVELGLKTYEEVTDTFIALSGLERRTEYYVYVGSECSDTVLWGNILSFRTPCEDEYSLPYEDNFDNALFTGNYSGPDCWENFYGQESSWYQYCVLTEGGRTGNCLVLRAHDGVNTSYAVMPKLNTDINKALVSFMAKIDNEQIAEGNIIVGVVTDMTNRETIKKSFCPVDTVFLTSSNWTKFHVPMDAYPEGEGHIAFSTTFRYSLDAGGSMITGDMYMDDVVVDSIPSCMYPEYLTVDSVSDTEIRVSFTELAGAEEWQLACVRLGDKIDQSVIETVSATTNVITGLEPYTDYDIYVRSVCDAVNDNFSPWTGPITQRTAAKDPVSKYKYDMADDGTLSDTWTFVAGEESNRWAYGTAGDADSLFISADGSEAGYDTTKQSYAWVLRSLSLEPGVYTFDYDWISAGNLRVGIVPAAGMFDGNNDVISYSDGSLGIMNGFIGMMGGKNTLRGDYGEENVDVVWSHVNDYIIIENNMAGIYHLVLFWQNIPDEENEGESHVITPSAAVKSLTISQSACVQPIGLYVGRALSTEADLTWEIVGDKSDYTEWEVYVIRADSHLTSPDDDVEGTAKVFSQKFNDTKCVISGLEETTEYMAFVRAACADAGSNTIWSEPVRFTTPCNPIQVGTVYDFDDSSSLPSCLTVGNTEGNKTSGVFSVKTNMVIGSVSYYALQGSRALYISSQDKNSNGTYLALPQIDAESLDNVQLTFWMRPIYGDQNGNVSFGGYRNLAELGGEMSLTVASMEDLNDISTYKAIRECVYPYSDDELTPTSRLSDDISGNDYWVKFSVPLKGCEGRRILLHDSFTGRKNAFYIDSVAIEEMPSCVPPTDIEIGLISDNSVEFSIIADDEGVWRYRCSEDPKMSDAITGEVSEKAGKVEGLKPATVYYLSVCRVCGNESSEWTLNKKIYTNYSVRFEERFSNEANIPDDWTRAIEPTAEVLFDIPESEWSYQDKAALEGWVYCPISDEASAHQKITMTAGTNTSKPYWMISPAIYLQPEQNAYMTFDLMMTIADSYEPVPEDLADMNTTFMVIVSDDGGKTWLETNATIWNTGAGTDELPNLNALTNAFKSVRIDLSQYQGKSIKVAFYVLPNVPVDLDLHIDNVYINSYETKEIPDNVCEECDYVYEPEDIVIRSAEYDMEAAQNVFEVFKVSDDGGSDNLYRFILNVNKMGRSEFYEEICEGNTYDGHGFTGVTSAGTHWRKLAGTGDRCDSVATLHLTVNPLERKEFDATMCAGGKYEWNGNTYTTAGDYTDTVLSVGDGCDTVVTLHLTTIPAMEAERTHYLCEGESLTIDGRTFTSDGSWKEVTVEERKAAVEEDGCDSVITHTVIYAQKYDMVIEAAICDGETYNKNGFTAQAERDYHLTETSDLTGCDSLVTLNLLVINPGETEREVTRNITVGQLPYNFYGDEYDENTAPGQYTGEVTVTSESGACSMTVKYTLNVGDIEPGTDNVTAPGELILTPNPVRVHETVMLHLDLTAAERDGLTVSVYGSTGALIERFAPDSEPIVIDGLDAAGVYMVRVTDGLGHIYIRVRLS